MKSERVEKIIRRVGTVLTIFVVCCIGYFSFSPVKEGLPIRWVPFGDKGLHLLAYAVYGFSCFLARFRMPIDDSAVQQEYLTVRFSTWASPPIVWTIISGTLLGAIVEVLQPLVGRTRDVMDLVANVMGLIVGLAIILLVIKTIGQMPWFLIDKEDDEYEPEWTDRTGAH